MRTIKPVLMPPKLWYKYWCATHVIGAALQEAFCNAHPSTHSLIHEHKSYSEHRRIGPSHRTEGLSDTAKLRERTRRGRQLEEDVGYETRTFSNSERQEIFWLFLPQQQMSSINASPSQSPSVQPTPAPTSQPSTAPAKYPSFSPSQAVTPAATHAAIAFPVDFFLNVDQPALAQPQAQPQPQPQAQIIESDFDQRNQINALYQQPYYSSPTESYDFSSASEPLFTNIGDGQVTVEVSAGHDASDTGTLNEPTRLDLSSGVKDLENGLTDTDEQDTLVHGENNEDNVLIEVEALSSVTLKTFRIAYAPTSKELQTSRTAVSATAKAMADFLNAKIDNVVFDIYPTGGIDFVSDTPTRRGLRSVPYNPRNRFLQIQQELGTTYISYGGTAEGVIADPTVLESQIHDTLKTSSGEFVAELKQQQQSSACSIDEICQNDLLVINWANAEKAAPLNYRGQSELDPTAEASESSNKKDPEKKSLSLIIGNAAALVCVSFLVVFLVQRRRFIKGGIEDESVESNSNLTSAALEADSATVASASSFASDRVRFPIVRSSSSSISSFPNSRPKGFGSKPKTRVARSDYPSSSSSVALSTSAGAGKSLSLRNFRTKKARPKGVNLFSMRNRSLGDSDIDCDALTTIQEGDCETSTVSPDDDTQVMQKIVSSHARFSTNCGGVIAEGDELSEATEDSASARSLATKGAACGSGSIMGWLRGSSSKEQPDALGSVLPLSLQDYDKYEVIEIKAPSGKLGLTVFAPDTEITLGEPFSKWCIVESIQETGPLFGLARPGDFLARIDKHDLSGWTPMQISDYIRGKMREERHIILCRANTLSGGSKDHSRDSLPPKPIPALAEKHVDSATSNAKQPSLSLPSQLRVVSDDDTYDTGNTGTWLQLDLNTVIGSMSYTSMKP